MNLTDLGLFLKVIRESRNLSLRQVEELSGVSASTISRIERGEAANCHLGLLARLTETLGYILYFGVKER